MKNSPSSKILVATVVALAALLLAGCQQNDQKEPAKTAIQSGKEPADSLKKDSVEAFDEQKLFLQRLLGLFDRSALAVDKGDDEGILVAQGAHLGLTFHRRILTGELA